MQNFYKKYSKYIIFAIGFVVTILLTACLIYINKVIFSTSEFKAITNSSSIKIITNNLLGFTEGIVVFATFILYLLESDNKEC